MDLCPVLDQGSHKKIKLPSLESHFVWNQKLPLLSIKAVLSKLWAKLIAKIVGKTHSRVSLATSGNLTPQKEKICHPQEQSREYNADLIGNSEKETPPKPPATENSPNRKMVSYSYLYLQSLVCWWSHKPIPRTSLGT